MMDFFALSISQYLDENMISIFKSKGRTFDI